MDTLSNSVYACYVDNFAQLPLTKQLHFASRLWLWNSNTACRQLLDDLRPIIIQSADGTHTLQTIANGRLVAIGRGTASAVTLREPYVKRYPRLRTISATLYWASLLDTLYGTDLRSAVGSVFEPVQLHILYEQLQQDDAALAILSTHAVNFLYLYRGYLLRATMPDPLHFLRIVASPGAYDLSDARQAQLAIYLLTHSVIGETSFYAHGIASKRLPVCRALVQKLEALISANFETTHLDNKFEFLVCCKLVDYESQLYATIMDEASRSISPDGTYLVDTHNTNSDSGYTTIEKSEHRNVLYLMATTEPRLALKIA